MSLINCSVKDIFHRFTIFFFKIRFSRSNNKLFQLYHLSKLILEIYIKAVTMIYFTDARIHFHEREYDQVSLPGTRIISSDPPRREGLNGA